MSRAGRGESSRFEAGFAKEIITPARGIALCGYCEPRPNEGVLDDLFVKALLIRAGRALTGVVSCDVIWLSREIVRRVRQKLTRLGVSNADQVLFCATHTHTGPYITPYFGETPDKGYLDSLVNQIVLATRRAYDNLAPAELSCGSVNRNPLAFNRRYFMRDGSVVMNPAKGDPNIVKPEGPVDRQIGMLAVRQSGRVTAILANIVNHTDTIGGNLVSADWPRQMEKFIQGKIGHEVPVLTLIGASGNINHFDIRQPGRQTEYAEARRIGRGYASIVVRALRTAKLILPGRLEVRCTELLVRSLIVTETQAKRARSLLRKSGSAPTTFKCDAAGLATGDPAIEKMFAAELLRFYKSCSGRSETHELMAIGLGGRLAILGLPGEPFTEIGLEIKKRSPFPSTFVVSLANGNCGYVPLEECYARGGYETRPVVGDGVREDTAARLTDRAIDLLNDFRPRGRT